MLGFESSVANFSRLPKQFKKNRANNEIVRVKSMKVNISLKECLREIYHGSQERRRYICSCLHYFSVPVRKTVPK